MAIQEIQVWAKNVVLDSIKNNAQRREIKAEEWLQGWGRLHSATAQHLNSLMHLLTHHAPPSDVCPYPYPSTATIPSQALQMDGQAITQAVSPQLFETYGGTLPDMTADNLTGMVWIVRNH